MTSTFYQKLEKQWAKNKFLTVGLDSNYLLIPSSIKGKKSERIFEFNKRIIDKTHNIVLGYKPNTAFYEAEGIDGIEALKKTISYVKKKYPDLLIILDAKRGDIGSTNEGYIKFAFEYLESDAITIHPYLGKEAIQNFLDLKEKGIIILIKTSNPGSGEFQNLKVGREDLYISIAKKAVKEWNKNKNIAFVVGATYPEELKQIRKIAPEIPFLIPGIGKQGGDLEKTIKFGEGTKNPGMIINSSRDIIFASSGPDFADAARKKAIETNEEILKYL